MRATESHDLVLNDVKVPLEHFVETRGQRRPNGWILHIPSTYLGIAQAARDYAVDFASHIILIAFKVPLLSYLQFNKISVKWSHYYYQRDIFYLVRQEDIKC